MSGHDGFLSKIGYCANRNDRNRFIPNTVQLASVFRAVNLIRETPGEGEKMAKNGRFTALAANSWLTGLRMRRSGRICTRFRNLLPAGTYEKARSGDRSGPESKAVLWILFRKLKIGLP
jgi:hypothetical protein